MTPTSDVLEELERQNLRFRKTYAAILGCTIALACGAMVVAAVAAEEIEPGELPVYAAGMLAGVTSIVLAWRGRVHLAVAFLVSACTAIMALVHAALEVGGTAAFYALPVTLMGILMLPWRWGTALVGCMGAVIATTSSLRPWPTPSSSVEDVFIVLAVGAAIVLPQRRRMEVEGQVLRDAFERLAATREALADAAERAEESARLARQADAAKSRFLASMSHELRTPLNAMLGYAQLVAEEAELDPDSREDLGRVDEAGRHLLGLIDDVLDIARIESGGREVSPEPFDLGALARDAGRWMAPEIEASGAELVVDAPDLPFVCDPVLVRQILLNLLGNAARYAGASRVVLRVRATGEGALLEVEDDGRGIPAGEQEAVFEPFRRGRGTVERHGGAGLGLALVRRFAQLLGGEVALVSSEGAGATFRVQLARLG
ncbi:MAG: HAMP domain-containing histidine kinase [Alphaproteobacteria bacterium]|nr:HAMP domain-containing histidine kinase [Alphaproteobacteria bacterium]